MDTFYFNRYTSSVRLTVFEIIKLNNNCYENIFKSKYLTIGHGLLNTIALNNKNSFCV
jgi:hypothetical protein